jgi:hypothetical protein
VAAGQYIGRVGGLAVALGIGIAIASTSGVASADAGRGDSAAPASSAHSPNTSSSKAGKTRAHVVSTGKPSLSKTVVAQGKLANSAKAATATITQSNTGQSPASPGVAKAAPNVAKAVVGALLTPLVGGAPTNAPVQTPLLWAVVGWLRNEFEYTVLGKRPTILPMQIVAESTGARPVQGTLNASGANSKLVYTVTEQPTSGTVTIGDDGQWTYTPAEGFSPAGGVDSFTVSVTDTAFHLDRLFGVPAYTKSVTVPVTVPQLLVSTGATAVYTVNNLTQNPLTVHYPDDVPLSYVHPVDGTVFQPGQAAQFQISGAQSTPFIAEFTASTGQKYQVIMWNTPAPTTDGYMSYIGCGGSGGSGTCTNAGNFGTQAILVDAPGTKVTVTSANSDMVNAILNNICAGDSGSCTFKATQQSKGYGPGHMPTGFVAVENRGDKDISTTVTMSDAVAAQSSWSVTAKATAKIFDIVSLELSSTYGQSLTKTHTFTQSITIPIAPGKRAILEVKEPVYLYTGDFTVRIANTTWYLPAATIQVPDALGNPVAQTRYENILDL